MTVVSEVVGSSLPSALTAEAGPPSEQDLPTLLESLLFVASEPVAISRLAQALEVDQEAVERALAALAQDYVEARRGLRLQRKGDRVQLCTMPEAAPYVERFLGLDLSTRLSAAALETLAIIAYRQPITRAEIEAVRGVNCDGVLRTLLARELIEPVGRLEAPGRPFLYGTTFQFLHYFGLDSLEALPPLPDGQISGEILRQEKR
jgi:segregation and condensation protein B